MSDDGAAVRAGIDAKRPRVFSMSVFIHVGELKLPASSRDEARSQMKGFIKDEVERYLDSVNWDEELVEVTEEGSPSAAPNQPSSSYPVATHREDCPGYHCTLNCGNSAEIAIARGWKAGTVIEGDEGYGAVRIEIQFLEPESDIVVAKSLEAGRGQSWTLSSRCWGEVS